MKLKKRELSLFESGHVFWDDPKKESKRFKFEQRQLNTKIFLGIFL
jgi:hypothetical protein